MRFKGTNGETPYGTLVQGLNGNFYGTTSGRFQLGGPPYGTVFEITAGGGLTTLYSFCSQAACADGAVPFAGLAQAINGNFFGTTAYGGNANNVNCQGRFSPAGCGTVFEITPGGNLTTIHRFNGTDGFSPAGMLVQAANRNFYGTTELGGANGVGTIFKITPRGSLVVS